MARKRGIDMFYTCEFEFYNDDEGSVVALCLNGWDGATFGDDLEDAGESAADWLTCMVDDCLINGRELPPVELGHEPQHGGMVIALAMPRETRPQHVIADQDEEIAETLRISVHVAHDQKRSRLEFLQAISDSRSKAAETMAKSLYAKACDKAKNAAESSARRWARARTRSC